jgi:hypothetical protein
MGAPKNNNYASEANKGNIFAQKHDKKFILAVLSDIMIGLVTHSTKDIKSKSFSKTPKTPKGKKPAPSKDRGYIEKRYREHVGYATLEEGFLANYLYAGKLSEWANRFNGDSEDDKDVTEAIKVLKNMRETTLVAGTARGTIPPLVGIFLLNTQSGYNEMSGIEDKSPVEGDSEVIEIGFAEVVDEED